VIGRRAVATLLAGAAALPLLARAQQSERIRRVAVIAGGAADDPDALARLAILRQSLQQLGWIDRRNLRIEHRLTSGNAEILRQHALELAALAPDVIVASGASLGEVLKATRTLPVVFPYAADPVGSGYVASLSRPGGNATGFLLFEFSMNAKWLELLKEIAPGVTRIAVLRDDATPAGIGQFAVVQAAAASFGLEVGPIDLRDAPEIERGMSTFARLGGGGLIVPASSLAYVHRSLIIALAARYGLPAIYYERLFASEGGLASYGADLDDQLRRTAGYVDRILKGEKPADLPVQAPAKYDLVINLKTANALGLDVTPGLLARADEVIE
jgi:putative tryptophan/tyrosine transport system substrate-binding protein